MSIKLYFTELLDIIVFSPYTLELHSHPEFHNFKSYLNSIGIYNVDIAYKEYINSVDYIDEIQQLDTNQQNICYRLFFQDALKYFGIYEIGVEHDYNSVVDYIYLDLTNALILFNNELRIFEKEYIFMDKFLEKFEVYTDDIETIITLCSNINIRDKNELCECLYQDYKNYIVEFW